MAEFELFSSTLIGRWHTKTELDVTFRIDQYLIQFYLIKESNESQ